LDEAPRALDVEPHLPVTIGGVPTGVTSTTRVEQVESAVLLQRRSSDVVPAQWTRDSATSAAVSSQAEATSSAAPHVAAPLGPLPIWPEGNVEEPRSHIVVDGDSLARLAGRYLDDPRRAAEIYAHNRHLLSDPELLPIGIELIIPPRAAADSGDVSSPQSSMPRAVAIHAREDRGLVPVRPVPAASRILPRAVLAPPRPPN
jgi:hypothetical protein